MTRVCLCAETEWCCSKGTVAVETWGSSSYQIWERTEASRGFSFGHWWLGFVLCKHILGDLSDVCYRIRTDELSSKLVCNVYFYLFIVMLLIIVVWHCRFHMGSNFWACCILPFLSFRCLLNFYVRQLTGRYCWAHISYHSSVRLSRPGTNSRPGEIETPGLHHMIA